VTAAGIIPKRRSRFGCTRAADRNQRWDGCSTYRSL